MGGSSSKSKRTTVKNTIEQNWELVNNEQTFKIVKNKTDGKLAQQHFYILDNRYDPNEQEIIFQKRSKSNLPIVRVYDYQWQSKGSTLDPRNNFRVITQHLTHRLSTCPQLTFDESLYLLDRSLQGYCFLYHSIGPFDINSNMIGFNQSGETKVWINQNLGRNYPYHQKPTLQSTRIDSTHKYNDNYLQLEEIQMVRNIVNMIQDRCEEGAFPEEFREKIRQNVGFNQARKVVMEEYNHPQVVKLNKVDLEKNVVISKISKFQRQTYEQPYGQSYGQTYGQSYGQPYGQTAQSYITGLPLNTGSSYISSTPSPMQVYPSQYQSSYIPPSNQVKNAYSFAYQRVAQA